MLQTSNRVSVAIADIRARIAELPAEKVSDLDTAMAVDASEHFAFQTAQSRAFAAGNLAADEAQLIYASLGETCGSENGGWTVGTDTATKVVVTKVVGELIGARMAA